MGVGASRPRKEQALRTWTRAAKKYNVLHRDNIQLNNLYRSSRSRRSLTWRQKARKHAGNLYNRVRHWRRRSNTAKIRSARQKAAAKLNRAQQLTFEAHQKNEASAKRKLNKAARLPQRQRYNAAIQEYFDKGYLFENAAPRDPNNNTRFAPKPGTLVQRWMNVWPHTQELERTVKRARQTAASTRATAGRRILGRERGTPFGAAV